MNNAVGCFGQLFDTSKKCSDFRNLRLIFSIFFLKIFMNGCHKCNCDDTYVKCCVKVLKFYITMFMCVRGKFSSCQSVVFVGFGDY